MTNKEKSSIKVNMNEDVYGFCGTIYDSQAKADLAKVYPGGRRSRDR